MHTLFYINYTCIFIVYTFCQHFKFPPKCMYYNVTPYSRICISITIAIGLIQIIWSPPGCASDVAFLLIDLSWEISRFLLCQIVFFPYSNFQSYDWACLSFYLSSQIKSYSKDILYTLSFLLSGSRSDLLPSVP